LYLAPRTYIFYPVTDVLCTVEYGIATLVINRPGQRNALNTAVLAGMRRALQSAAEEPGVRVIAITGAGDRVFCAGADLKPPSGDEASGIGFGSGDFRQLLLDIRSCPKPTVALARGHVMAGGLGIVLACDLALGCDDIHISTPEIQVGMFPMMVLALLFRHVGRKRGTEMLFLGERISAPEARDYGILNRIFDRAQFDGAAAEYLEKLSSRSSAILRLGKEAMSNIEEATLAADLEYLESQLGRLMATEDSREGRRSFLEKRTPRWKNR
jgi:enoyl-CoA hydratase/carnithine racemase